jgi:hypothetical protein
MFRIADLAQQRLGALRHPPVFCALQRGQPRRDHRVGLRLAGGRHPRRK